MTGRLRPLEAESSAAMSTEPIGLTPDRWALRAR